jgi:hypothetical protein
MSQYKGLLGRLMREIVYKSQVYSRKVTQIDSRETDDGVAIQYNYDKPVDKKVIDWLERNSVFKAYQHRSPPYCPAYVFMGTNQTLCALIPEMENDEQTKTSNKEHKYLWKIYIRYQPADKNLPVEITRALEELGFQRE